ncbi:MAG TPA: phage holin family protein [Burkholderiales bacterium]|nr:phage holin family protein [Burkholderiales bacterium]
MGEEAGRTDGLFGSLRRLGRTLVLAARTRLDLVAAEVEEQGLRVAQVLAMALAAMFCLGCALVLAVAFVIVLFWDDHRLLAIGGFAALFALAGFVLALMAKHRGKLRPRFLSATVAELDKDAQALSER